MHKHMLMKYEKVNFKFRKGLFIYVSKMRSSKPFKLNFIIFLRAYRFTQDVQPAREQQK